MSGGHMSSSNRILKYLKSAPPIAECVVISDISHGRVILSYDGTKMLWKWDNGLICPGASTPLPIDPLAAEALITEEMTAFLKMEGVNLDKVIYVSPAGEKIDGIIISPQELGVINFDIVLKKDKIKELYERLIDEDDNLSEEIVGEAISYGVLSPFLSLVNL